MNIIWRITEKICSKYTFSNVKTFLALNTLFWGTLSLIPAAFLWQAGIFPKIEPVELFFIFVGYAMSVPGMFGGIIYLMRRDIRQNKRE